MNRLIAFLEREVGLDFGPSRFLQLERGLAAIAREQGYKTVEECLQSILDQPDHRAAVKLVAPHITTGETYFWREPETLRSIENEILPALVSERLRSTQRLRFWTAGCSTGEETYSLAIMLRRIMGRAAGWDVRIFGTDINQRSLDAAKLGHYRPWAFRGTPDWILPYFTAHPDHTRHIQESLKEWIAFDYLNLAESFTAQLRDLASLDIILCRNVMMYMKVETMHAVLTRISQALAPGGYFVTGATESHLVRDTGLFIPADSVLPIFQKPSCPDQAKGVTQSPHIGVQVEERLTSIGHKERGSDSEPERRIKIEISEPSREELVTVTIRRIRSHAHATDPLQVLGEVDETLKTDALNPELHYLRAIILRLLNNEKEAIFALRKAIYLLPQHALAHVTLGILLVGRDRSLASRHFRNALDLLGSREEDEICDVTENITVRELRNIARWQLENV